MCWPIRQGVIAAVALLGACSSAGQAVPDGGIDAGPVDAAITAERADAAADGPADVAAPDAAVAVEPFSIALVPDPQYYTASSLFFGTFTAQLRWIVDHRSAESIALVTVVGDLVDMGAIGLNENEAQWERADRALKILDGDPALDPDGVVPYAAVAGNHDYDVLSTKPKATQYLAHFGPARYAGRTWFLGASADGMNMAQRVDAGGTPLLHLGLEWRPTDEGLVWAQAMLDAHPTWPAMITTHEYLEPGDPALRVAEGDDLEGGAGNSSESLFHKLVEPSPQVFLIVSGHLHGDGHREAVTALGHAALEVVADYQFDPFGGNGWMQLIRFAPQQQQVSFTAFSPTYEPGKSLGPDRAKSEESNYHVAFDLEARRDYLQRHTVLHFREGYDGGFGAFSGTQDTYVVEASGTAHEDAATVCIVGGEQREQGLLRFDGIVGAAPGQIAPGTRIERALLTLTTEGEAAESADGARFHRMRVPWLESVIWQSLTDGVDPGTDAELQVDLDASGQVAAQGTRSFDVTSAVQAWVDGAPNYGWALLSSGEDRWTFRSSDWAVVAERPLLTVVYRR